MNQEVERGPSRSSQVGETAAARAGLAGWLLDRLLGRLHFGGRAAPRLAVLERIALAPRQSLALIEAEGRRFLVATCPEGTPAFYPLEETAHGSGPGPGPGSAARYAGMAARRAPSLIAPTLGEGLLRDGLLRDGLLREGPVGRRRIPTLSSARCKDDFECSEILAFSRR
jgi:hypothetical protein